mmetsp:Transcript_39035/g.79909  ORF Transcript_39035/g.79909 Transcript_39035/m.79909 type:complete len:227 (+) Transcript_39035:245-925(+)
MTNSITRNSVLILGATGRTGLEILYQLSKHNSKPDIHAFVRDTTKLSPSDRALFKSIVKGDARSSYDIKQAIDETNASVVVIAVGNGDNVAKSDIRTTNAHAVVAVLDQPQYSHIHAVVISSNGAGPTKIKVGLGIGTMIAYHLRHVLRDHTGQEAALVPIMDRTVLLRPTALTDKEPTGKPVYFGDKDKPPTINISRTDVAAVVAVEICDGTSDGGKIINLTNAK